MANRVVITILDNGSSVSVPQSNLQLVIGTSSAGVVGAPLASTSPTSITNAFGSGPLVEAMGLIASVGGVPIGVRAATATPGSASAVTKTGAAGASVMTVTGNPNDTYQVVVKPTVGGTIGTGPCGISVSLDNGRTSSPTIQLGAAATYAIPGTGITLNFTAATLGVGDAYSFGTVEPLWSAAGIQAAINAFLASSYKAGGVGSIHVVGGSTAGGATGSDMVSIGTYLQTMRTNQFVFSRAYISARDASPPAAFGGTGESESVWMAAIATDYQGQSLNDDTTGRICACAAYWNTQSVFASSLGFAPRLRKSVAYAAAQRQVLIAPQRMPSRVKDGALSPIVIGTADKSDGFVYHDESISPGLDTTTGGAGGNFSTTTTIQGFSGIYLLHANLFSPSGSQYGYMPRGLVIDLACSLAYQEGVLQIDDDVRLVPVTGTMDPRDAITVSSAIGHAIDSILLTGNMSSGPAQVTIDPTAPIGTTGKVPITIFVPGRGYILSEAISVGFAQGT